MRQAGGEERRGSQGAIPVSEYRLHDEHWEVIRGAPAHTLHGDGNVGSGKLVIPDANLRANESRLGM